MIDALLDFSFAKKSIIRGWYECLSALDKEADVTLGGTNHPERAARPRIR
jgi:hypothetical protein